MKQELWSQSNARGNDTKFIIVSKNIRGRQIDEIFLFFDFVGALNIVVLHKYVTWKATIFNQYTKMGKQFGLSQNHAKADLMFPDKQRDMNGYAFRVALAHQYPKIFIKNEIVRGIDAVMLSEIAKALNATVNYAVNLTGSDSQKHLALSKVLRNREVDLNLNTGVTSNKPSYRQFINTYDISRHCAIIPIPPRLSFLHFLLTPFDAYSWIFMIVSIVICAGSWRLLSRTVSNSNSTGRFVFGVIANFFGQSVSFRQNRRMQVILLQLCILMTFIMGNAYQSLIIASMSISREGVRMTTVREMFESNLEFIVDRKFDEIFNSSEDSALKNRFTVGNGTVDLFELASAKTVIIARCDHIEAELNVNIRSALTKVYYLLPEMLTQVYEELILANRSPFYEKLQKFQNCF